MEKMNLGKVMPTYKNAWDSGAFYEKLDIVVDNENTYISLDSSLNEEPALNSNKWALLAPHSSDNAIDSAALVSYLESIPIYVPSTYTSVRPYDSNSYYYDGSIIYQGSFSSGYNLYRCHNPGNRMGQSWEAQSSDWTKIKLCHIPAQGLDNTWKDYPVTVSLLDEALSNKIYAIAVDNSVTANSSNAVSASAIYSWLNNYGVTDTINVYGGSANIGLSGNLTAIPTVYAIKKFLDSKYIQYNDIEGNSENWNFTNSNSWYKYFNSVKDNYSTIVKEALLAAYPKRTIISNTNRIKAKYCVEGLYPSFVAEINFTQSGSGEPSLTNIRPIKRFCEASFYIYNHNYPNNKSEKKTVISQHVTDAYIVPMIRGYLHLNENVGKRVYGVYTPFSVFQNDAVKLSLNNDGEFNSGESNWCFYTALDSDYSPYFSPIDNKPITCCSRLNYNDNLEIDNEEVGYRIVSGLEGNDNLYYVLVRPGNDITSANQMEEYITNYWPNYDYSEDFIQWLDLPSIYYKSENTYNGTPLLKEEEIIPYAFAEGDNEIEIVDLNVSSMKLTYTVDPIAVYDALIENYNEN